MSRPPPSSMSTIKSSSNKLQNGWQEALITEYFENGGGATIYIPHFLNDWIQDQQHQQQEQQPDLSSHQDTPPRPLKQQQQQRGKVCILSIDGGGMRGIIPAKLLAHLESILQQKTGDSSARLVDFFDIVAGTNMGGIIAAMLFTAQDNGRPLFTAQGALDCISQNGRALFKPRHCTDATNTPKKKKKKKPTFLNRIFSSSSSSSSSGSSSSSRSTSSELPALCSMPKLSTEGLESVLKNVFMSKTLRDTLKPLLVPCYDLATAAPFLFSRAGAIQSSAWDFCLYDVCRAASSTPGLFPPAAVASVDGTTRCTAVDAGMVMNNPAAAALTHVLHNGEEFPGVRSVADVLLLSLGTGSGTGSAYGSSGVAEWGSCQWARPAADIVADNVSDMVDQMLALAYSSSASSRDNYLRLQVAEARGAAGCEMDDASERTVIELTKMAEELLQHRAMEHMGFGGIRPLQKTNAQLLDCFADQLIQEHGARARRSSPTVVLK